MNNDGKLFYETIGGEKRQVGRPKTPIEYVSPYPQAFDITKKPESLQTELTTRNQIRNDSGTLIWGSDDALPMHILDAIAKSPTTSSCISRLQQFTQGESFKDEGLMTMVINKDGETLWDVHCQLVQYFCSLDGFSVNFKFNSEGKITNSYCMNTAAIRFAAEAETSHITGIKYNPYWGTSEYKKAFTTDYSIWDSEKLPDQIKKQGTKFQGQVYWHATKNTLYKHYPVPKFWSGSKWIYSDAKLATYIDTMLDNGFFSSVLMNVIGDPNKMSKHPDSMREVRGDDGVIMKEPTKTEGEVFGEMMASNFSGVQKAAKALVTWSMNKDQSVNIQAFPTNTNFDFVAGTLRETIRMITIATEVPGILANLPDEVSPLSGQDSIDKAIQLMISNTKSKRNVLENFYNNILIPNLVKTTKARVEIKNYSPVKTSVTVDDKFWEFMNEAEKINFITKNEPNIVINRAQTQTQEIVSPETLKAQAALRGSVGGVSGILQIQQGVVAKTTTRESAISILTLVYGFSIQDAYSLLGVPSNEQGVPITDPVPNTDQVNTDQPQTPEIQINDNLKNMTGRQQQQFLRIIKQFGQGKLTPEQASVMLRSGFGLSEEEITSILTLE